MITTITLNPAVDKIYIFDKFTINKTNRVLDVKSNTGGKGINVARICRQFCEDVRATGFLGGDKGNYIRCGLKGTGVIDEFINIREEMRNCIAIYDGKSHTEIIEQGPHIYNDENKTFMNLYSKLLESSNVICASGSLPRGVTKNTYYNLIEKANKRGIKFLLDTEGEALKYAIEAKPYFIKVSVNDLEEITKIKCNDYNGILKALTSIDGVNFKIVSLETQEVIAQYEGSIYRIVAPKMEGIIWPRTSDAFVAGIAVGIARNYNIKDILKYGMAAAISNGKEDFSCNIDMPLFYEMKEKIIVEEINELSTIDQEIG